MLVEVSGDDQHVASDKIRVQQSLDAGCGQAVVIRRKAVAFAGDPVDCKPFAAQHADRLVYRRARHAQPLREHTARQTFSPRLFQRPQHRVLDCQPNHPPVPDESCSILCRPLFMRDTRSFLL